MNTPEIRPGIRRLFRLAAGRNHHTDADEEIQLHLKLRAAQFEREGMTPDQARAEAERRFGEVDQERERFTDSSRRAEEKIRWREWFDSVRQDTRYAIRTLRRDAGFTTFATLIVALGIGASTTVFSLVNGVLLRQLPFRDPSRLVWISNIADDGKSEWRLQVNHLLDLGRRSQSLEAVAGYYAFAGTGNATLTTNSDAQRLTRLPVTCNFIPFLGVKLLVGRSFTADECVIGAAATVMITEPTWRNQFAADPNIVGRTVVINDVATAVIGVLPASFDFASVFAPGSTVDFLQPFPLSEETNRRGNTLAVIGRLKPNVPVARARTEIVSIGKDLTAEFPRRNTFRPKVLPLDERVNGQVRPALLMLALAVAAVMLIVSANLSSLQFARMSTRRREIAVRLALGAARGRLIRQTLTESLLLAGGGAMLGLALAAVGTHFVSQLSAFNIPLLARVGVDGAALGITAVMAILTGVLVGVLPALSSPRDVHDALKESTRGTSRGAGHTRVRSALVITEIAAACVLLVASSLLVRSFLHVLDVNLGFRPEHTLAVRVESPKGFASQASANAHYDDVLQRVRAVRGAEQSALADILPFGGDRSWGVAGEGQVYERGQYPEAFIRVVSDGYFKTMGIPLNAGRDFNASDVAESEQVVIVNKTLARTLWPNRDAVGQAIMNGKQRQRVIAVVGDVRHDALEREFTNEMYIPLHQTTGYSALNLVTNTNLSQAQLAPLVRNAVGPIAPVIMKNPWISLQQLIDKVASPRRFVVVLLGGFSVFALVLAALGIYALISYGVSQRTQEIGIRLALGASARNVRATIVRGTLVLAATGIVIGSVVAAVLVPSLRGMLFGVETSDPVSFGAAMTLLVVVAAAAGHFPARRASRINPGVSLREG